MMRSTIVRTALPALLGIMILPSIGDGLHGSDCAGTPLLYASLFAAECEPGRFLDPQEKLTISEQEQFISDMVNLILDARWNMKKADGSRFSPDREDRFVREIDRNLSELNEGIRICLKNRWLTDPACWNKFKDEVKPQAEAINKKWKRFLQARFPYSCEGLVALKKELNQNLDKKNYDGCLTRCKLFKTRIGSYYFDYVSLLDEKIQFELKAIMEIEERAEQAIEEGPFERRPSQLKSTAASKEKAAPYAYLVSVCPKSGTKYEAVIKDPSVIARIDKARPLALDQFEPDARLSFHYMRGLNGSTAVRVKDIAYVLPVLPLTRKELEDVKGVIGKRITKLTKKEVVRLEVLKKNQARRAELEKAAAKLKKEQAKKAVEEQREAERFKLLAQFPPDKGWSEVRREEIEQRKIVVNVFPSTEEQAFLDHFEEWKKQYAEWTAQKEKKDRKN